MTKENIAGISVIEFVILIAIIAVIALVAVPKFNTLILNAESATTTAVASALTASNASNLIIRKADSTAGIAVANCADLANTMQGGLPKGYAITSAAVTIDTSVSCTLTGPYATIATFTATGIN